MNYKEVFDLAPVGVLVTSADGAVIFANQYTLTFMGYSDTRKAALPYKEIISISEVNSAHKNNISHFLTDKNGKKWPVNVKTTSSFDNETGSEINIHYFTPSDSEIPFGKKNPVSDKAYLNAIMEHFPDVIYFKDKESRFLNINQAYANRYKRNLDFLIGKNDFDLFTDEHAQQAFDDEQMIVKTETPIIDIEEQETWLDGTAAWVSTSKMPFYDENKNLIGTFGVSKDVTDVREIILHKKENASILNAITTNIPLLIYKFDRNRHSFEFIGKNDQAEYLKKSKIAKLNVGKHLSFILDVVSGNKDKQGFLTFSSSYSENGNDYRFDNYFFDSEFAKDIYIGISIDVTERKIHEYNIKKYTKSLEKINKELNQFAYIISHDLKAPLRGIINLSEWIEEDLGGSENEEVKENLRLLRTRVGRMENLLKGILNYSRANRETTIDYNINVESVIKETVDSLAVPDNFEMKIASGLPAINYNKNNLERIFANLVSNAVKYHDKPKGIITIDYRETVNFHEISVADNGPGIAPEFHDKIFMLFQTLQSRDSFESTGIGLTIVKKIVENWGGSITLKSEISKGTKFIFTIPKKIENINSNSLISS
jgi:PAS domain S-box-containing protein